MEVKPIHIVGASIVAFLLIVAANMLTQYQSNEAFRDKFKALDPSKFLAVRKQLIAEEQMEAVTAPSDDDDDEDE